MFRDVRSSKAVFVVIEAEWPKRRQCQKADVGVAEDVAPSPVSVGPDVFVEQEMTVTYETTAEESGDHVDLVVAWAEIHSDSTNPSKRAVIDILPHEEVEWDTQAKGVAAAAYDMEHAGLALAGVDHILRAQLMGTVSIRFDLAATIVAPMVFRADADGGDVIVLAGSLVAPVCLVKAVRTDEAAVVVQVRGGPDEVTASAVQERSALGELRQMVA